MSDAKQKTIELLSNTDDDEFGDILIEVALEYWTEEKGISRDEFLYIVESMVNGD